MNLLKKGLIRGLIPFILFTVTSLIWMQFEGASTISKSLLFYGLIAFFLGLASIIYEVERWRFIHQILVHYLVMLVTVFPTLLLSGAYPVDSIRDIARVYFLFNQMGLILFFSTYFLFKWRNRAYMREQNE
ncbi:DUF3021 family protein [Rossellomorea sp. KS-H15a]|uniref:DUF3021 family protein n=1 Tax=Rossellomorea sp. KS-H15a TaxID=2963940 RepID=UPI0020C71BA6|nr:DUF3021 family protein [Rossellomorea sp. KS-H15a]UTE78540.1 DUF3021 domain-containing protein [Rossellomorea sp. KS-H15a]